jgi:hypothetical protein
MATTTENYSSTTDSAALTLTLASLATSSTLVTGRQSTVVDNTSNKYVDALVTGQITTGTSPTTAKTIAVYVFVPLSVASSTFVWPKAGTTALGGGDGAATFDAEQRSGGVIFAQAASTNATSDRPYSFSFSLRQVVGYMPLKWGLFVTHDTAVSLNSTAGNHWFHYVGEKFDTA